MKPLRVIRAGIVSYPLADEWQRLLHERRVAGEVSDLLLLLEHPHTYTLGRRFSQDHLLVNEEDIASRGIEVCETDRGGSITYHGPGQLVGYPIVDLRKGGRDSHPSAQNKHPDVIAYLRLLEEAIIRSVKSLGVMAGRRPGLTGVWVGNEKVAALGVHVSRNVTKHGFAVNVTTDLSYYDGMIPCGITEYGVTSLEKVLGRDPGIDKLGSLIVGNLCKLLHRIPAQATEREVQLLDLPVVFAGVIEKDAEVIPIGRSRTRRAPVRGVAGE